MSIYHDEIEIEDMEYDEDTETYYYPCPCGDRFQITKVSRVYMAENEVITHQHMCCHHTVWVTAQLSNDIWSSFSTSSIINEENMKFIFVMCLPCAQA